MIAEASGEAADTYEGETGVEETTAAATMAITIAENGLALGSLFESEGEGEVQLMDKTGRQPSNAEDVRRRLREGGCRG